MRQDSSIPVMEATTSSESPNTDDYGESPREFGQPHTPQAGGRYYNQLDALPENGDNGGSRRSSTQQTTPAKANWLKKLHAFRWYQLWYALRWKLATNVFSRPIPVLTANFDVKLGDLIILIPVAGGLTALGAVQLAGLHTKDAGSPASIAMAITFALSVRNNSLLLALTGLSFERAIFYHKLFGFVTFVTSTMHVLSYFLKHHQVYGSSNLNDGKVFTQDDFDNSNADYFVTGMIAYGPLVLLLLTAFYVIRRKFFEIFLRFHWLLFIVILVGCLVHGAGIVVVGFVFWAIDAVYRLMYQSRVYKQGTFLKPKTSESLPEHAGGVQLAAPVKQPQGVAAPSQVFVSKLSSDVVCIQFPKIRADTGECFHYEAGQFAFLCIPKLSWLEWHPFSISSTPHEPFVTFHIRALGDWTQKLLALADSATDAKIPSSLSIEVFVDGPYGNVSVDIATPAAYSHFALFSGGIGITPMKAIVNQLHFEFQHLDRAEFLQRVHFVWSVRDRGMVQGMVGSEIYATHGHDGNEHEYTSYFPQQLKSGTDGPDSVFSTEIFLTQSERDLEHPLDLALQSSMRYASRPDIAEILRTVGNDALAHGKKRVAVLACGPAAMIKDVVQTGMKLTSTMGVRFDVHTEKFEF